METNNVVKVTTAQLAKAVLLLKGKPLSMEEYLPMTEIYDVDPPMLTVKASRQIGKTAGLGAILVLKSIAIPNLTSMYISPLSNQASRFSTSYLDPYLNSPKVRKHFRDASSKKNVFEKTLNNGSVIYLSYCETESDADRTRGVPNDSLYVDEVQDISSSALPIIYEASSASDYNYRKHFGTAKSEQNTLEVLFKRSNSLEWCVPCTGCGKYSIPWTMESCLKICANKEGPCCEHCGKLIDMKTGKWIAAKPSIKNHYGFHVPRFILPARVTPKKWGELQERIETMEPSTLANEVFGLPSGQASRILSQREAIACCNPAKTTFESGWPRDDRGILSVVLGVDWSVTGGVKSYTVVSVLGYNYAGKPHLLYSERIQGVDILDQVKRVATLYRQFGCQMMGSDRGVGQVQIELLRGELGIEKVVSVQYCAAKEMFRYDRQGGYLAADRTQAMDNIFIKAKMGRDKFETPCWELMSNFWSDALAIFEEESHSGRRLYRKDDGAVDDWFHSVVFGHISWMCLSGHFNYVDHLSANDLDGLQHDFGA